MKGLVCAGGEATRLGELTRVTNKHLLPVGSWPMVYYPLQLLQLAGIREVLVVTGKGHAGQMIDLLGDGHLSVAGSDAPLLELDLTYKVQTRPGGIAEVVGMAEDFAAGEPLVVVLGDNIFEYSHAAEIAAWGASGGGAQVFVKDVPDPENFGVVVYDDAGDVVDLAEKAGVVDLRYPAPPTNDAVVGLYCYPADVFAVIASLERSSRGELEITDVNRAYAAARRACRSCRCAAGGRTPASTGSTSPRSAARSTRPARTSDRRGNRRGSRCTGSRTSEAGSASCDGRAPCPSPPCRPMCRFRAGASSAGLHFHERGQDDLFACLQGTARVVVLDRSPARRSPRTSATTTPLRSTSRAATPTASRRSPICSSSTT